MHSTICTIDEVFSFDQCIVINRGSQTCVRNAVDAASRTQSFANIVIRGSTYVVLVGVPRYGEDSTHGESVALADVLFISLILPCKDVVTW
jgi:hypothetical protein